jgi:CDP-diacylglycerol--glycerol-3-phosphate 3-phosphatidyltransferase
MTDAAPSPWNIANLVTMARIVLVPVFAWALLVDDGDSMLWRLIATGIFLLAALSDRVDGHLARSRGLVTDLGKILDPIADKALTGTALVLLWWPLGELPWWVPAIILVRELGITVMRMFMLRYAVMPASRGGKIKTVLQVAAITIFLLPLAQMPDAVGVIAWIVMWAAIVVTLVTGADYVAQAVRIRRDRGVGTNEPGAEGDTGTDGAVDRSA